ncbi:hypothetical protein AMATHDRAFT_51767 [Amanita thiersii Skay4041]|uniref:Uncharacterized protein n=1 Tax=Amanita thiersii Skay4041 TaxID=703135 RepID=A0A2A9NBR7_9AGAR|nr:hypothetical protein AMATHDRAFT_51767 [Amanita thiersii Skay4041]
MKPWIDSLRQLFRKGYQKKFNHSSMLSDSADNISTEGSELDSGIVNEDDNPISLSNGWPDDCDNLEYKEEPKTISENHDSDEEEFVDETLGGFVHFDNFWAALLGCQAGEDLGSLEMPASSHKNKEGKLDKGKGRAH